MNTIFYEAIKDSADSVFAEEQIAYSGRLHFHRAFEIAYIIEGRAEYTIEDKTFIAEAGDIVFAHCYYRHTSSDRIPHRKHVIAVPERLTRDIAKLFENKTLPMLLSDKAFNLILFPCFDALVKNHGKALKITEKGYASVIFGSVASHYDMEDIKRPLRAVSQISEILQFVDDNYTEPLSLESISAKFGYNKTYFSRMFNRYIGMSLTDYINMVRYDNFEKLLKNNPENNITNLALECGFSSLATFYRVRNVRNK